MFEKYSYLTKKNLKVPDYHCINRYNRLQMPFTRRMSAPHQHYVDLLVCLTGVSFVILSDAMTPYRKAFQMFLTASGMQQGIYRDLFDVTFRLSGIAPSTAADPNSQKVLYRYSPMP